MQKYEEYAIKEMLSMSPGLKSDTLANYLTRTQTTCIFMGVSFDAIRALDDLSKTIRILKSEIEKAEWMPNLKEPTNAS